MKLIFTHLFDTCITLIMDYFAEEWGLKDYPHPNDNSKLYDTVFYGVHIFAPTTTLTGVYWDGFLLKKNVEMVRLCCRLVNYTTNCTQD